MVGCGKMYRPYPTLERVRAKCGDSGLLIAEGSNPPLLCPKCSSEDGLWKYYECPICFLLWPHLVVPDVCVCGNDIKKNYHKKSLKLIKFAKSGGDK